MKQVLIIGGGAAGLLAALGSAEEGAEVTLLEKNDIVGKKMGITGKGRCNLTNSGSVQELIAHTPGNGKFLFSAYRQFDNQDLIQKLHSWGLETKVERGGRVFPCSDSAIEVRKTFYQRLKARGVSIVLNEKVKAIKKEGSRFYIEGKTKTYESDACIIATGGMSYPGTGSTGDGYRFAQEFGHSVTELRPSLIPLTSDDPLLPEMQGLSLKNVEISLYNKNKELYRQFGEMIFTHFGISGPIVLSASFSVAKCKAQDFPLLGKIDMKPALSVEKLEERLLRDFQKYSRKHMENALQDMLPKKMILPVLKKAGILPTKTVNQVTKEERRQLLDVIKGFSFAITGTRPIAEAIVTAGGVGIKEVNPSTMESKIVSGLYFAGEVLDVDAYTGGYNLQAAFSMGYVAGRHSAKE